MNEIFPPTQELRVKAPRHPQPVVAEARGQDADDVSKGWEGDFSTYATRQNQRQRLFRRPQGA